MDQNRYRRIPLGAGFREPKTAPDGTPLCRRCGQPVPMGRRAWCSQACIDAHTLETQPSRQAAAVLKRDHGVCASCGLDCVALLRDLRAELVRAHLATITEVPCRHPGAYRSYGTLRCRHEDCRLDEAQKRMRCLAWLPEPVATRARELAIPPAWIVYSRRLWEVDHTVPVVEGGGSCGLDNLRTLCWACHRRETRALAARRARRRKTGS